MEATTYCEKLIVELDACREEADHIASKLDNVASCDREKVLPEVIELHMLIEELRDRMDRVRKNLVITCPKPSERGGENGERKAIR